MTNDVLCVRGLTTTFDTPEGLLTAVDDVDLSVGRGEMLGIVGESGCGKSVFALSVMGLVGHPGTVAGSVRLGEMELVGAPASQLNRIRGRDIAMIFQHPKSTLDPVMSVGRQVAQALEAGLGRQARRERVGELLEQVGIDEPHVRARGFAHQLSGGMAQRVMIAGALAGAPSLLIADEPTTALDVTVQAQVLELLVRLRDERGLSVVLISHDLDLVGSVTDRIAVMYAGQVVELGETSAVLNQPQHPYTQALLRSRPAFVDSKRSSGEATAHIGLGKLATIAGTVPRLIDLPSGCRFAPRCERAAEVTGDRCIEITPALRRAASDHQVRCWLYD